MTEHRKIDGRTKRAADIALAKRSISRASYDAILAGRIGLDEAKAIGRDGAPATDTGQGHSGPGTATETSRSASAQAGAHTPPQDERLCLCGCAEPLRGRKAKFRPGRDMRLYGELKRNLERDPLLRNERFTGEQKAYTKSC